METILSYIGKHAHGIAMLAGHLKWIFIICLAMVYLAWKWSEQNEKEYSPITDKHKQLFKNLL